jgi:hypothetical protein
LRRFFLVFKTWRWPQPVLLTKPHDAGYGLPVWSPQSAARQVAPVVTPAYPAMNSTLSVSRQTLQILQEEFNRAHVIVDKLWKDFQKNPSREMSWDSLFEPSDFFISYPRYLSLCIVGPTQADAQAWCGFVESRFRKLVSDLLGRSLPLKKIQLWPKKLEVCIADKGALLTKSQRENSTTYFVGFRVDTNRMRGDQLNIEAPMQNFREWELSRFQPLVPGSDILVKAFKVKDLPKFCFEGMYPGGKLEAMKKRRKMLDADPERLERKRLERLEELKTKMAEIQRKKDEQQDKKRKRTEVDLEEEVDAVVKEEQQEEEEEEKEDDQNVDKADEAAENEEAKLLESALDTIQDAGEAKTREEAEADRQKLLAGELLVEGEDGNESEEDEYGYTDDRARHSIAQRHKEQGHNDIRSLPVPEEDAEMLRKLGFAFVGDDEMKVVGANMSPPWQSTELLVDDSKAEFPVYRIRFREKFDIVELDANGHVVDKGDDDFMPSKGWIGRKAGFEFKLGERGLGYYRTGKKVVVPSNTAY